MGNSGRFVSFRWLCRCGSSWRGKTVAWLSASSLFSSFLRFFHSAESSPRRSCSRWRLEHAPGDDELE